MSEPKFNLYRDPKPEEEYKGEPVKRLQGFDEQKLFESTLDATEYDTIMYLMRYLQGTVGVNSVCFDIGADKFCLEIVE